MLGQVTTIAFAAAVLMLWSIGASALPNPALPLPDCGCIDRDALSRALWLAPRSRSIRTAERRLSAYRAEVHGARSEAEVARKFGQLVRLADSGGVAFDAHLLSSCAYSTLEIIAIVIGFVLGILPGIILLLILC